MSKNKIYVVGSGWGSSSFVKNVDTSKYEVTVVSPSNNFTYTPLLANQIKDENTLEIDIKSLNNINYKKGKVINVNFKENKLITDNNEYSYDYLVLSHGSEINTFGIDGVNENCYFIKSTEDTSKIKCKLNDLPSGSKIAVIGCSLTGSEIIGNLIDYKKFNIYAVDGLNRPLSTFNNQISNYALNLWKINSVNLYFSNFVNKIDKNKIYFKNKTVDYDMAIWCGGIKISKLSNYINKLLNLECKFGIPVNKNLKVLNTNNVYAIGDCAYSNNPPTAQVASQQGIYLARYFNNNFNGNDFKFNNKGQICYIGNGMSVYQNNKVYFTGKLTGYFNKVVHLYNSINLKQSINLLFQSQYK